MPAMDSSDGARSKAAKMDFAFTLPFLAFSTQPGPQTMSGERVPPSYNVVFEPRKGPALPAPGSGPLSEQMSSSVLSRSAALERR